MVQVGQVSGPSSSAKGVDNSFKSVSRHSLLGPHLISGSSCTSQGFQLKPSVCGKSNGVKSHAAILPNNGCELHQCSNHLLLVNSVHDSFLRVGDGGSLVEHSYEDAAEYSASYVSLAMMFVLYFKRLQLPDVFQL